MCEAVLSWAPEMKMGCDFCAEMNCLPQRTLLTNVHIVFWIKVLLDLYSLADMKCML